MELDCSDLTPGRAYHVLCSLVAPRPIAWVTTEANGVVNAAPFSWFQAICADPPMVMVAVVDKEPGILKDTARNAIETKEFVVNIARGDQLADLVATSMPYPANQSETDALHLETVPSHSVKPPRLAGTAGAMECKLVEHKRYGRGNATTVLIGEVVRFHLADDLLTDRDTLDVAAARLPARLGGNDYSLSTDLFQVDRPTWQQDS